MNSNLNYDVVVIGSGGGGLRASISSAMNNCNTLVITKGKANRSGATLLAGANISADIGCDGKSLYNMGFEEANKNDSKQKWYEDLITEGFYVNDETLVRLFVNNAEKRVSELINWGMKVKGLEGDRGISVEGTDILDTLMKKAKEYSVSFLEDSIVTDIVVTKDRVCGVVVLDVFSGDIRHVSAKSVIIATGGIHSVFPFTTGSTDLYGDGQAIALRAGCELVDMEYVSFCPTVIKHPERYKGNLMPYIMNTFGYGHILNKNGKEFISSMFSKEVANLAYNSEWNKLLISYAMQLEINKGKGTKEEGVYFAINKFPKQVFDEMYRDLPGLTKNMYKELISQLEDGRGLIVSPAAHYFEGGIKVNGKTMGTKVEGLYSAGECTGGLFGANRVSAATTEMLVEGELAGEQASVYVNQCGKIPAIHNIDRYVDSITRPFSRKEGISVIDIRKRLQSISLKGLWVIRNEENLIKCIEDINDIIENNLDKVAFKNSSRVYNKEWLEYISLRNMCQCLGAIAKSALLRKESRGVHIREDYMETDNKNWLKRIVIQDTHFNYKFEDVNIDKNILPCHKIDFKNFITELVSKLN